jgi:transposase InsO family protein
MRSDRNGQNVGRREIVQALVIVRHHRLEALRNDEGGRSHRHAHLALAASGLDRATVVYRPRLLTENGASYIATGLAKWLDGQGMEHVRGAPYHPQTQGKIERWHQTLKNRILLENYYLPGDLEREIEAFIAYYNHRANYRTNGLIYFVLPAR